MKTCPNCGQAVADGAGFCPSCGSAIPADPQPVSEGPFSFCPQCGEKVPAGSYACPNCGTVLQAPPQPAAQAAPSPAKTPMPRNRLIGIAAVAVAVLLIVVAGAAVLPGMFSTPADEFISYHEDLFMTQVMDQLEDTLDTLGSGEFSSDLTLTASVGNPEIQRYLNGSSVELKVALERDSLLANGAFSLMGSPVLSGTLTYDQGQVGFCLPEVDDTYYVADLSTVVRNFTGQDLDLSVLALPEISGSEWRSLFQSYLDLVYTVVTKDSVTQEKNAAISLTQIGRTAEGTLYTFTPRAEDVEAMLIKLADHLEKDDTLRGLVMDLVDPDTLTAAFGPDLFGGYDLETELDSALTSAASALRSDASYIAQSVVSSGFTWTLGVEGKQVRLIRIDIPTASSALIYERDGDGTDSLEEVLYFTSYGETALTVNNSYTKSDSTYTGSISLYTPYDGSFSCSYTYDEDDTSPLGLPCGSYDYYMDGLGGTFTLTVEESESGGYDHTLSILSSDYAFSQLGGQLEITLNATEDGSAQAPSSTQVDISDYTEAEYYQLFNQLGSVLYSDLIQNLAPLMSGMYGW